MSLSILPPSLHGAQPLLSWCPPPILTPGLQLPPWRTLNPAQVTLSPDLHTHLSAQSPPLEGLLTCSALEELIVPSRLLSACGLLRAGLCSGGLPLPDRKYPEGGDCVFVAPFTSSHLSRHSTKVCESMKVWMPLPEGGLFPFQTHQCILGPTRISEVQGLRCNSAAHESKENAQEALLHPVLQPVFSRAF